MFCVSIKVTDETIAGYHVLMCDNMPVVLLEVGFKDEHEGCLSDWVCVNPNVRLGFSLHSFLWSESISCKTDSQHAVQF